MTGKKDAVIVRVLFFFGCHMFKRILFQLHWLVGISAGTVLAVMGLTGALYSFGDELIHWMDPAITKVDIPAQAILSPKDLLDRVKLHQPNVSSLTLSSDPGEAARVGVMTPVAGTGQRKFELFYLNPYTGELLGKPASEDIFRGILHLHRKLMWGDTGKSMTGASTLLFLFLLLSGVYLRWPKIRRLDWRTWLLIDVTLRRRNLFAQLHAVAGTWMLPAYLCAALTGLAWSYDWYHDGLREISHLAGSRQTKATPLNPSQASAEPNPDLLWATVNAIVPRYKKIIVLLPSNGTQTVQILYLDHDAAHPYANNRMLIDGRTGELQQHERYSEKTLGEKLMSSLYAIHSGHFFGTAGRLIMMLASLLLPFFLLTGWIMYLQRLKSTRHTSAKLS